MILPDNNTALLLIDIQQGFDDEAYWGGNRNNTDAEQKCHEILIHWRTLKLPIFHIRHSSTDPKSRLHPSHYGYDFHPLVTPQAGEVSISKEVNSAFIGTDLQNRLDQAGIKSLVIVGLTTNHCISTTTRMAGNLGYDTYVISDATATFDRKGINGEHYDAETIHLTSLANLQEEFATILTTKALISNIVG